MGVLEVLAGAGVLVLVAIWREAAETRRQQTQATGWLKHIANRGQSAGPALRD